MSKRQVGKADGSKVGSPIVMKDVPEIEKIEAPKPVRVCVACQQKLEETVNMEPALLFCHNQECPRMGLVTVIFAQLRRKNGISK